MTTFGHRPRLDPVQELIDGVGSVAVPLSPIPSSNPKIFQTAPQLGHVRVTLATEPPPEALMVLTGRTVTTLRADADELESDAEAHLGVGADILVAQESSARRAQLLERLTVPILVHGNPSS
jgi:hypothetical protein